TEGQIGGDDDAGTLVELRDEVEEQLPAGLGEGQVAEFVEHDEVEPGQMIGNAALPPGAGLGLQPVDQIDDVEEASASTVADQRPGNGDGQMRLAGAGAADQDDIALIGDESAAGKIADQGFVDRSAGEVEVVDVFGQRELGDGELVFDRAGLLLGNLGRQQIADDLRWLVLA